MTGLCSYALAFSTLLSSQETDAHHPPAFAAHPGQPLNFTQIVPSCQLDSGCFRCCCDSWGTPRRLRLYQSPTSLANRAEVRGGGVVCRRRQEGTLLHLPAGRRIGAATRVAQRSTVTRAVCLSPVSPAHRRPACAATTRGASHDLARTPDDARSSRRRGARSRARPKLRGLKMPGPPLACAFAPSLPAVSGYFFRVRGMAAPMRSNASFCRLVGPVRTGTAAGVPAKRSSLRVRVPRWSRRPW
jgi:hypothetical protein